MVSVRLVVMALAALVSSALADKTLDPQYAVLTITVEQQLAVIDAVINAVEDASEKKKAKSGFAPVKKKVESSLYDGNATLEFTSETINAFLDKTEKQLPGFTKATTKAAGKNRVDFYGLSPYAPEASWAFLYNSLEKAVKKVKDKELTEDLKELSMQITADLASDIELDGIASKVTKWMENAESTSRGFNDIVREIGDKEIAKFQEAAVKLSEDADLDDADSGSTNIETLPPASKVPTKTPAADTTATTKPTATKTTQSTVNSSSSVAGEMTVTPRGNTTTPAPSNAISTRSGHVLVVVLSVVVVAVTYGIL
ncbi:hypothetical protein Poli38472_010864 [Pythium oligandrum]|uniref:Uncharacterized protein n=1 Tax=Pythium oligandrum TaxID=41045 RepID=A0A8K1FGL8_PYTOL|nr:hypothetical protein Poli38472_010864 [Pythium oligandrum]|eukprot:TMW61801.1 hypothetical protein Poli38472_010864 [Pythium oligandrum]